MELLEQWAQTFTLSLRQHSGIGVKGELNNKRLVNSKTGGKGLQSSKRDMMRDSTDYD